MKTISLLSGVVLSLSLGTAVATEEVVEEKGIVDSVIEWVNPDTAPAVEEEALPAEGTDVEVLDLDETSDEAPAVEEIDLPADEDALTDDMATDVPVLEDESDMSDVIVVPADVDADVLEETIDDVEDAVEEIELDDAR